MRPYALACRCTRAASRRRRRAQAQPRRARYTHFTRFTSTKVQYKPTDTCGAARRCSLYSLYSHKKEQVYLHLRRCVGQERDIFKTAAGEMKHQDVKAAAVEIKAATHLTKDIWSKRVSVFVLLYMLRCQYLHFYTS